ncbi:SemiSWEET family sugar transporter [[Mycoplasma] mobile]|uniref:Expressed protein n=1 Tax=Mycoplasma mobile (strain ATCC 43663 / 163K / NCTC 11711) TaxID=267748 RepID=Q6KH20_MYCM1|nr:PQ-loop domain-containing transporter [[Mycoplasma] mobile]AAT28111.1 expressed protein [Mycoplasma mobile 163K]
MFNPSQLDLMLTILSTIAAIASAILFLPQLFKSFRTKMTSDTSLFLFIISFLGSVFWLGFGIILMLQGRLGASINLIWQNSFVGIIVFVLLSYKLLHMYKAKKLNISEAQFCHQLNLKSHNKNK